MFDIYTLFINRRLNKLKKELKSAINKIFDKTGEILLPKTHKEIEQCAVNKDAKIIFLLLQIDAIQRKVLVVGDCAINKIRKRLIKALVRKMVI